MTIPAGSRLGPYEILGQIGAGGMGEVYRAKDPRLGREVAIKVLPASFSADPDRLRRFEQEAKAAGVLNHPNITAVYDIGTHEDAPYVVQELLEGETLRAVLAGGRVSPRKAIEYSLQIAHGLSAAHEKGIVHRDLKPENLFVTRDARLKILDFGLAKLTHQEEGSRVTNLPTATAGTEPGVVLGTLGYMSPEQVRGKAADARSDIFSFGAILYEMLSGQRAFHGDSAADTMSSILREDPPDLSVTNQNVSPGVERIVRHCLEKNPEQRFHSAHDVAFALEALSVTSGAALAPPATAGGRSRARFLRLLATVGVLLVGVLLGFLAGDFRPRPGQPSFKRLTFRKGVIWTARFAPDGQTVVYSAAWEGKPVDVFLTRPESPESRPFGLKDASLFGVSTTGELAVMLGAGTSARAWERFGTLARLPLAGGSPRPVLESVRYADWGPDGRELMVERPVGGKHRLEFPIGKALYESPNRLETPRVSPDGSALAFFEVDVIEGGQNNVAVRVVDLAGKARTLASASDWWNLAWSPDGQEIWYSAPEAGQSMGQSPLQAVSLSGKSRLLLRLPGTLELHDVARNGRVLFSRMTVRSQIDALVPGESASRELSWLDRSELHGLSADGKTILFAEVAEGGGPNQSIYLRGTDGSPATLIGEGQPHDLSRDGRWVLATDPKSRSLVLLPTGTGSPRTLAFEGLTGNASGAFLPSGEGLVVENSQPGQLPRLYVAPVGGGKARPLGSPGLRLPPFGNPVSPDGRLVAAIDGEQKCFLLPTEGGEPRPLAGAAVGEIPIQWSADGKSLYVHRGGELPAKVWRLEIASGRRELVRELVPRDPAGVLSISNIFVTPDGRSFFFSYGQILTDLYVVEGLK